ncbi:MAG: ABC transporter ATP-binding protein, partial [Desulfomonilaceae bacterium]
MTNILELKEIKAGYGDAVVIKDISFSVDSNTTIGIIGPNGAGKTTLLKSIAGLIRTFSGEIYFNGNKVKGDYTERIKLGIRYVPQGGEIFPELNVIENLKLGASILHNKNEYKKNLGTVFELFPILKQRQNQKAGYMSGGERQMLAIGMGLMSNP